MDILARLAPPREEKAVEATVSDLTPTMIADNYMYSKINSVRMAQLRGYEVPEEEAELIRQLTSVSRAEAHRIFIEYYTEEGYLTLPSLSVLYSLSGEEGRVMGPQRSHLTFIFYASDGVDLSSVSIEDDTEVVIVGLSTLPARLLMDLQDGLSKYKNTKLVSRLTSVMTLWPIDHPHVPRYTLYKKGADVDHVASSRGVPSLDNIAIMNNGDPFLDQIVKCYGAEEGDLFFFIRTHPDPTALVTRSSGWRLVK